MWHSHLKAFFWKRLKKDNRFKENYYRRTTINQELRHKIIQVLSVVLCNNCSFIHTVSCPPTFCFWPWSDSWYLLCRSSFWAIKMTAIIIKIRNSIMYKSAKENNHTEFLVLIRCSRILNRLFIGTNGTILQISTYFCKIDKY